MSNLHCASATERFFAAPATPRHLRPKGAGSFLTHPERNKRRNAQECLPKGRTDRSGTEQSSTEHFSTNHFGINRPRNALKNMHCALRLKAFWYSTSAHAGKAVGAPLTLRTSKDVHREQSPLTAPRRHKLPAVPIPHALSSPPGAIAGNDDAPGTVKL